MLAKIKSLWGKPKKHYFSINLRSGRTIDVMVHGNRKKNILLCIGGLGTPHELFIPLAKELKKKYCCVSFEYQWKTINSHASGDLDNYVDDLKELIDFLNLKRFSCIAFCMGAKKVLRLLDSDIVQPEKLILINPNLTNNHQTEEYSKLSAVFKYIISNPDSKSQAYNMMQSLYDIEEADHFKKSLAKPYSDSPETLFNFSSYANAIISGNVVDNANLFFSRESTVIWDTDSELSCSQNCCDILNEHRLIKQIYVTRGGHYSLFYCLDFMRLVISSLDLPNQENNREAIESLSIEQEGT
ncbi:alpha/beta fold hydrolase [Alteromonas portus]|uniref:alpha/beta fold hydrolase n=1 Tax=Alteromonas portus TaxID=2565549 RepID=UPI003BF905E6